MSKKLLINNLVNYEGYSQAKAKKIVNAVIEIWKQSLSAGKDVEIEGLGTLSVVRRRQRRRIERNLRNVRPTILTVNRQPKTVKLRSRRDLSYKGE
jgi:nucleoid DNA-binding protein